MAARTKSGQDVANDRFYAIAVLAALSMTWVQGVVAYTIIWWLVIFAVLPFGVRPLDKTDIGYAAGAPANPRLWLKAGITTVIAAVVWLGFYALVTSNLISFREP
jgi:predicted secreted protein